MEYEGQICRPPMERASFMLAISVGCAYNRCKFCNLFKHLKYRVLPMEQIEGELKRVKAANGNPKQVFLGDGNAFGRKTEDLLKILDMIHNYFPACEGVNMDAAITDISRKTDTELQQLKEAGVSRLYVGIESGLDDVLIFMDKDHNLEEAYCQIRRIQSAGLIFNAHIMTGIAGAGRGIENGIKTAEFFNCTKPERITNFSLFLDPCTPLYQEIEKGRFIPASELENLKEERKLLELLETDSLIYDGFHDYITFRVRGTLPKDREKMLAKLDHAIAQNKEAEKLIAYGNCFSQTA
ncbi:radical SAM protein [bacterium 1XD42-1]|nr:radical SAM protein [bacterium 1XD42-8]RKJ63350.1 radical SAM protein [bacterium 1XD42-1]